MTRRWARRAFVITVAIAALVGVLPWVTRLADPLSRDDDVVAQLSPPPQGADAPLTFLVVGNDSRERISADAGNRLGPLGGISEDRADLVMVVQTFARSPRVKLLSLPRDLRVDVPGFGLQKLAVALTFGGSALLTRTVGGLTGLPINHYVEIDMVGFARAVDRLGGVVLEFPVRSRDRDSGFGVEPGRQRLDGKRVLAYARSRYFEEWRDGAWVPGDDGDIARIRRQHQLIHALVQKVGGERSPIRLAGMLGDVRGHVRVDSRLSLRTTQRLVSRLASDDPDTLDMSTLPTHPVLRNDDMVSPFPPSHFGTLAYDEPVQPDANRVIAGFGAGPMTRDDSLSAPHGLDRPPR